MESKTPIGLVLNELRKEKRFSAVELAERLGVSKQAVYDYFKRTKSMSLNDLNRWATALEMPLQALVDKSSSYGLEVAGKVSQVEGDSVVIDYVPSAQFALLQEQLREKDKQIKELQEMLKQQQQITTVLLGKSLEYLDLNVISYETFGMGPRAQA